MLFEEVDILYEDDKGFFGAIMQLMQTSKRPIILTCNGNTYMQLNYLPSLSICILPITIRTDFSLSIYLSIYLLVVLTPQIRKLLQEQPILHLQLLPPTADELLLETQLLSIVETRSLVLTEDLYLLVDELGSDIRKLWNSLQIWLQHTDDVSNYLLPTIYLHMLFADLSSIVFGFYINLGEFKAGLC